jgi:uncharacterized protein (DUF2062 family)
LDGHQFIRKQEHPDKSAMPNEDQSSRLSRHYWKQRAKTLYRRLKSLQGDPQYVAMGMAVGVFVAFTPTIPFHTALTIALAFVLRGSKPAAIIGSWINNPLTFPFFYYSSYKVGVFLLGHDIPGRLRYYDINYLMTLGWKMGVAMVAGGVLLGILPAIGTYFLTLHLFIKIRARRSDDPVPAQDFRCSPIDLQNAGVHRKQGLGT